MKQRGIEILSQKSQSHAQTLAREAVENDDMNAAIASISAQRDERTTQRDRLKQEITSTQKAISRKLDAQRKHTAELDVQARFNNPELDFWVDYLCMRIEGLGQDDRLKFVFTHVDERDWDREAWFDVSVAKRDYEIISFRPRLEKERVDLCLDHVNESRDLGVFLKDMRDLFVEAMK